MSTPRINFINVLIFILGGLCATKFVNGKDAFSFKKNDILMFSLFIFLVGGAVLLVVLNSISILIKTCKTQHKGTCYRRRGVGKYECEKCNDWDIITYT
jgi:hypothetical protein